MRALWLVLLCCLASPPVRAETFSAKVIMVMDGDTVMVLRDGQKVKVRLANIDAPEVAHAGMGDTAGQDQAYGQRSRDSLQELVGKRQVQIDTQAVDQYGRIVGVISADGLNINEEQVRRGMAWEYSHYHSDRSYIALQESAQQARRGLWSQASPLAPWLWRKSHPSTKTEQTDRPAAMSHTVLYDSACGNKRRCAEMSSCDEARFYLTRCGQRGLDVNSNGIPCEALCKGKR